MQGMVFMHEQGVAHRYLQSVFYSVLSVNIVLSIRLNRDCARKNLLMDADALYPEGYHPVYMSKRPEADDIALVYPREYAPAKYYYIDFGISSHIPADSPNRLVVGDMGRDQDVPELSEDVPYDPFKVDVFILGNLMRQQFCGVSRLSIALRAPAYSFLSHSRTSDS